jgi:Protein of unknown function (DUF4231)
MDIETSPARAALTAYIEELHRDYQQWYDRSVKTYNRAYWILQCITLFAGFLTAVFAALPEGTLGSSSRYILIVLPLCGSLAAGCLLQFRVYDLWKIRAEGFWGFQSLVSTGRRRLASAASDQECSTIHAELQAEADRIEKSQTDSFFATAPPSGTQFSPK